MTALKMATETLKTINSQEDKTAQHSSAWLSRQRPLLPSLMAQVLSLGPTWWKGRSYFPMSPPGLCIYTQWNKPCPYIVKIKIIKL